MEPTWLGTHFRGHLNELSWTEYYMYARSGVSVLIHGVSNLTDPKAWLPETFHLTGQLYISYEGAPELYYIAEAIHAGGALAGIQVWHPGRASWRAIEFLKVRPKAPSAFPEVAIVGSPRLMPVELSVSDIKEIIEAFALAMGYVRDAGFEFFMPHGTHGFLINQFLSPFFNRRTDAYGGDWDGRCRFLIELIDALKSVGGTKTLVILRLCGWETMPGGITPKDFAQEILPRVEETGVPWVDITTGPASDYGAHAVFPPTYWGRGVFIPIIQDVKRYYYEKFGRKPKVLISTAGSLMDPGLIKKVIREEILDLVGWSRPLECDPLFPIKMAEGREDEIRMCIRCSQGCVTRCTVFAGRPALCTINPAHGRERVPYIRNFDWVKHQAIPAPPGEAGKKVIVVGAGPAGIYAALMSAQRGHKVILFDKDKAIGGYMKYIAKMPTCRDYILFPQWGERMLKKWGVDIRLNVEIKAEDILREKPDILIIATGSEAIKPPIKGAEKPFLKHSLPM
jgi:2,4-dienoyl-CoA reductase-like NADH-dependent reductase (Old Yellow Enzyme family)